jgi:hypothetical protein
MSTAVFHTIDPFEGTNNHFVPTKCFLSSEFCLRVVLLPMYVPTNIQGYHIGRIVAFWVIVFFGQFFYYKSGKIIFHGKNYVPISPLAIFKEL